MVLPISWNKAGRKLFRLAALFWAHNEGSDSSTVRRRKTFPLSWKKGVGERGGKRLHQKVERILYGLITRNWISEMGERRRSSTWLGEGQSERGDEGIFSRNWGTVFLVLYF